VASGAETCEPVIESLLVSPVELVTVSGEPLDVASLEVASVDEVSVVVVAAVESDPLVSVVTTSGGSVAVIVSLPVVESPTAPPVESVAVAAVESAALGSLTVESVVVESADVLGGESFVCVNAATCWTGVTSAGVVSTLWIARSLFPGAGVVAGGVAWADCPEPAGCPEPATPDASVAGVPDASGVAGVGGAAAAGAAAVPSAVGVPTDWVTTGTPAKGSLVVAFVAGDPVPAPFAAADVLTVWESVTTGTLWVTTFRVVGVACGADDAAARFSGGSGARRCTLGTRSSGGPTSGTESGGKGWIGGATAGCRSAPAIGPTYMIASTRMLSPAHTYRIRRVRSATSPYG
jgi:hypothetical protein